MGRKVLVVFCLFLAVVQRAIGQSPIGRALPCQAPDVDPDPQNPEDNLSCPVVDQSILICYSRNQLCDGVSDCVVGSSDEGENLVSLDCNNQLFTCTLGVTISVTQLCDGEADCSNGNDESTTLCENKCLLPYYGGCSYTRECITSEFDVDCGDCLPGFVPDPEGDCLVEIGFENLMYNGSEFQQTTDEICAVIFTNPADFADGSLQGTFNNIGITTITVQITPAQTTGASNAATAVADFLPQQMTVSLSADQLRACVQVAIIADAIVEPNEVFDVGLTTSTSGVAVRLGREVAQVNILEMTITSLPTIPTTTPTPSTSLPTIPTTTPTPSTSLPTIPTTTPSRPPCMGSTVSDDTCEGPQGDNIAISTYIIIIVSVVSFLLVLTTVIIISSVLLWLSRRKREPELVDNVSYHPHTIEIQNGAITAPPTEVSVATSMATTVPQSPGESGDIATAANVAYELIGPDIVMSAATSMPTPPSHAPQSPGASGNVNITTATNVAYAATDIAKYYVNPAYQPLQEDGSDNTQEYDYALL